MFQTLLEDLLRSARALGQQATRQFRRLAPALGATRRRGVSLWRWLDPIGRPKRWLLRLRPLLLPVLAGLLLWRLALAFSHRVPPGAVDVRQSTIGSGLAERDQAPGCVFSWPLIETWQRFDSSEVWLRFGLGAVGPLELRTRDDNPAVIEVAVLYRRRPGEHHRLLAAGLIEQLEGRVRATTEDILRSTFAGLESEQWFETDQRLQVAAAALEPLRKALAPLFVDPLEVRISQVTFSKEFEQKLQEKRLAFQAQRREEAQQSVNQSKQELTEALAVTGRAVAEVKGRWDRRLAEERSSSELAVARLRADSSERLSARRGAAESAYVAALAEGQRALSEAQALAQLDALEVLAGPGGEAFLAAEAAKSLRIEALNFDPETSRAPLPLDLDAWQALLTPGEKAP